MTSKEDLKKMKRKYTAVITVEFESSYPEDYATELLSRLPTNSELQDIIEVVEQ